ncbi:MAG: histidine phosphatase family protein [Candidatus ainarchaeum sp.]|nr:histidine phosphatase family protein [Candidatus ainarchaeum sp.]
MQKIILFRAGEVKTKEHIFLGWLNLPLSDKGIKNARIIAKNLSKQRIDFAFCSDQLRGKQALLEVVKTHKTVKIIIDHRLRERNYGIFSGHEKKLFKDFFPEKYAEVHRSYYANIPNGENLHDVSKRVFSFMNDLIAFMQSNDGNVLICAHNNSLRLIREFLEELSVNETELLHSDPSVFKEYNLNFNKNSSEK